MKPFLFSDPILPDGFKFPSQYLELVRGGTMPPVNPWVFMAFDMSSSLSYYGSMLLKYENKPLIPFAMINDQTGLYNDGYVVLALFDGADTSGNPLVRIYDYSNPKKPPWDNKHFANFKEWVETAKQESQRYHAERNE